MSIRVAGICGSLREGSLNKGLLRAAAELAPAGMEIEIYSRLGDIPPYNDDVFQKGDPEPVANLKNFIGGADALLISTPESRRAQKRHRLGVATCRKERSQPQA